MESQAASAASTEPDSASYPTRPVLMAGCDGHAERRADGSIILTNNLALEPFPPSWNHRLVDHALADPDRPLLTQAGSADGGRDILTYGQAVADARAVAQWLIDAGLDAEKPLAILSENSIACAVATFGAMMAGIAASPISPGYALMTGDHGKLRRVLEALGPGAVFVADGDRYGHAVRNAVPPGMRVITAGAPVAGRESVAWDAVLATVPGPAQAAAEAAVRGDTVAKILFTSGSSGDPKPVMLDHLMLASNRQQNAQIYTYLLHEPPVLVDWLPWHHTFGGNNNLGFALWCGGTLHIDDGKPTPKGIAQTIALIKQFSPTIYFSAPSGFEAMLPHLRDDPVFRKAFFARLKVMQYGGALLQSRLWKQVDDMAVQETGTRILMVSGIGSTEAGPTPVQSSWEQRRQPEAGLPVPGVTAKLAPFEDVWELRLKGDCITTGYWRRPDLTEAAFDEEGYFCLGDAVGFVESENPARGLLFIGRISDNFKLSSGTWVQTAAIRQKLLLALSPALADAVISGANQREVGAIAFPDIAACRRIAGLADDAPADIVAVSPVLRDWLAERLATLARDSGGSSQRIARFVLESEPPSMENGEMTDKGSASGRAVLTRRAAVVEELHDSAPGARIIAL